MLCHIRKGYILPTTIMPMSSGLDSESVFSYAPVSTYHSSELLFFALIGVLGGLLGCVLLGLFSLYRAAIAPWSKHRPLLLTACSGLITLIILHLTGLYLRPYSFSYLGLFQYDFLKLDFLTEPSSFSSNSSRGERSIAQYMTLATSQALLTLIGTNCPVSKLLALLSSRLEPPSSCILQ
jgi:H+/Cl- antiporter ClcA